MTESEAEAFVRAFDAAWQDRSGPGFAALWDAALVQARGYSESVLATRALDGIEVPVFHRGEIVAYVVKHDARLLLAHLKRLDRQIEENAAAQVRAGRFDELLAAYAGHEAPKDFAEAAEEMRDGRNRDTAPDLPPTREDYVIWARSEEIGGQDEDAEARRMENAGKAAGKAASSVAGAAKRNPKKAIAIGAAVAAAGVAVAVVANKRKSSASGKGAAKKK